MHHTLSRFIQGIRQDNPAFDWHPQPWHSDLAKYIPAPAVYGIFGEATFNGKAIQVRDDWQRADRFKDGVRAALGDGVRVEYVK